MTTEIENIENNEVQEQQPAELNIRDLATLKNAIEVASSRAAFKAEEMAAVGIVYNKLSAFLDQIAQQAPSSDEGVE